MSEWIAKANQVIWGPGMLVLFVGTGVFLTLRLHFLPWRNLKFALCSVFQKSGRRTKEAGDITPFESLMTALAATIGTGSIVGVATAMVLGGPGALVWMWISALFGLSTKYAESVLAVKYRECNARGEMSGGPMYAMKNGFSIRSAGLFFAFCFSVFTVIASFGIGNMTQSNSIAASVHMTFGIDPALTGLVVTVLTIVVLVGGIQSIGKVCSVVVPFMAVFYLGGTLAVILGNLGNLPDGLIEICSMAFSKKAACGGAAGTMMGQAVRFGVARGVFTNEAGLGSAPIAAAAAQTDHPSRQGYINMTGTFFTTLVVCSMTGLAIAASGMLGQVNEAGEILTGSELTIAAFSTVLGPFGGHLITISLALFAFSSILGWEYYGEKALEYLMHSSVVNTLYRVVFSLMVFTGAVAKVQTVWDFSDMANGLMAVPNLLSLILLSNAVAGECFAFEKIKRRGR